MSSCIRGLSREEAVRAFPLDVVAQATITEQDIDEMRRVGLSDREILAAAALTAYNNRALRASQALGVSAR